MNILNELSRNVDDISTLWTTYRSTHEVTLRNKIVEHYMPTVARCAREIQAKAPRGVDYQDLYQAGVPGLMEAIESFDPTRAVKFETFAYYRVRGAILDAIRRLDWVPRLVRQRARQVEQITEELHASLGHKPNHEEISAALGTTPAQQEAILSDSKIVACTSMHKRRWVNGNEEPLIEIADDSDKTTCGVARGAETDAIRDLIGNQFTRTERMILMLYYYDSMTRARSGKRWTFPNRASARFTRV